MNNSISVIIPALNEESNIERCLLGIQSQTVVPLEVIVVDNGSTDKTVEVARSMGAKVMVDPEANISGLRNRGAAEAKGNLYAFIDADCYPDPSWLAGVVRSFSAATVGITGSHCAIPEVGTWVEKAWYYTKPKGRREVNFIGSANLAIRSTLFRQVAGFDEGLITGEDYDICQKVIRAGFKVCSDERLRVYHGRGPKRLIDRARKEMWYGRNTFEILREKMAYLPFWASVLFLAVHLVLVLSAALLRFQVVVGALVFLLVFLAAVSAFRCIKCQRYKYYFHLIPIYYFYLLGRSLAIVKLSARKLGGRSE